MAEVNSAGSAKLLLYNAVLSGNLKNIELLLEEVSVAEVEGSVAMHIAVQYGRKDMVTLFLNKGISVNSRDRGKYTPLHYLAVSGDISSVHFRKVAFEIAHFIAFRGAYVDAMDWKWRTPCVLAAQRSRKYMVELFIDLGANPECCDEKQWSVLHHACAKGWTDIVRTILQGKRLEFDPDDQTSDGRTPAMLAARCSHGDIVQLLLESGANIEMKDGRGRTLLHHACRTLLLEGIIYLTSKGCDLNVKDNRGATPLMFAADWSRVSVVEYLLEHGAGVEEENRVGETALHWACKSGSLEVVKSLIRKGSDVNAQTVNHDTSLLLSVKNDYTEIIKPLIIAGADCNVVNIQGEIPLILAIQNGNFEIIKHLIVAGADCNVRNIHRKSPFNMFISRYFCMEVITLFLKGGAVFTPQDYFMICNDSLLRESILRNVQLLTMAIINKFNNVDLPEIPLGFGNLPPIEQLKIARGSVTAQNIAESLEFEIQTQGYCNNRTRSFSLRMLCLRSLFAYYDNDN